MEMSPAQIYGDLELIYDSQIGSFHLYLTLGLLAWWSAVSTIVGWIFQQRVSTNTLRIKVWGLRYNIIHVAILAHIKYCNLLKVIIYYMRGFVLAWGSYPYFMAMFIGNWWLNGKWGNQMFSKKKYLEWSPPRHTILTYTGSKNGIYIYICVCKQIN